MYNIETRQLQKILLQRQETLRDVATAVILDIDDTLLDPGPAWLQAVQANLPVSTDLEEIYRAGGFYNYFSESSYREQFFTLTDQLKASESFNFHFQVIDGAREGLQALQSLPGVALAAYLTARPDKVYQSTVADLKLQAFPRLPLLCKPEADAALSAETWKMGVLLKACQGYRGRLVMIDDNIRLARIILEHNRKKRDSKLVSVLLQSPSNRHIIREEEFISLPEYGCFVANWRELSEKAADWF